MSGFQRRYCIFGCDALVTYGVPLHRFPNPNKRPDMFAAWIAAVGSKVTESDHTKVYMNKRICGHHFEPTSKTTGGHLICSAIPTLNLNRVQQTISTFVETDHSYCQPRRESPTINITNLPGPSRSGPSSAVDSTEFSAPSGSTCLTSSEKCVRAPLMKFDEGKTFEYLQKKAETQCARKARQVENEGFYMDKMKERTLNMNASDVEVCRICLATDVKLHSLQDTHMKACLEFISGFSNTCGDLPKYVCYECAPILLKYTKLIEKSKTAQATLLDIFDKYGQVNKTLIKDRRRSQLDLQSSLDSYLLLNYFYIKYDDNDTSSEFAQTETVPNVKIETENPEIKDISTEIETVELKDETAGLQVGIPVIEVSDGNSNEDTSSVPHRPNEKRGNKKLRRNRKSRGYKQANQPIPNRPEKEQAKKRKLEESAESDIWSEFKDIQNYFTVEKIRRRNRKSRGYKQANQPIPNRPEKEKEQAKKRKLEESAESDIWSEFKDIQSYFTVEKIPFNQQRGAWKTAVMKCDKSRSRFVCKVCLKTFLSANSFQLHSYRHNDTFHGKLRCWVCLVCVSTSDALKYHTETVHANRFHCKFCPMVFSNIDDAKNHKVLACIGSPNSRGSKRDVLTVRGLIPLREPPSISLPPMMGKQQNWYPQHW